VRPGSIWTDDQIIAAAEADEVDESIVREITNFQLYQRVPQVTPYGALKKGQASPERATFGSDYDPLRAWMMVHSLFPIDQDLSFRDSQSGADTFLQVVMGAHAPGSFVIPACRVQLMTAGQEGQINEALASFTYDPVTYNAFNNSLYVIPATPDVVDAPTTSTQNNVKVTMPLNAQGGFIWIPGARNYSETLSGDPDAPPKGLQATVPHTALIVTPNDAIPDGADEVMQLRTLTMDLTGLPANGGITAVMNAITPCSEDFGKIVALFLSKYYGRTGPIQYFFPNVVNS
jgi:hypothetical protein